MTDKKSLLDFIVDPIERKRKVLRVEELRTLVLVFAIINVGSHVLQARITEQAYSLVRAVRLRNVGQALHVGLQEICRRCQVVYVSEALFVGCVIRESSKWECAYQPSSLHYRY